MSFKIPLKNLNAEWKDYIKGKCNIWEKKTKWNKDPDVITIFKIDKGHAILPLAVWYDMHETFPNQHIYDTIDVKFEGQLIEIKDRDQKTVVDEIIKKLKNDHTCLLALRTGFGKTLITLYLVCYFKMKAIILCHATTLHPQWVNEAKKWCPNMKIQIVEGNKLNPDADVYIMGVIKSTHFDKNIFDKIGVVIAEEVHLTYTKTFSDALLQFSPKYLIGLSATPDRRDGMHKLLYPYFGDNKEFIVRVQIKSFTVIKYITNFKPDIKYNYSGDIDWTSIISSLAYNNDRQRFIVNLCQKYSKHKILILSNRVCECVGCKNNPNCKCSPQKSYGLVPMLQDKIDSVDFRVGNKKTHDEDARILVGTFKKLGVGYDSTRTLLILASDVTDVRQNEGRIRADNNIVIDIVDDFKTLEKHWDIRETWYKKRGATITFEGYEKKRERLLKN